jgi:hypothetical protein
MSIQEIALRLKECKRECLFHQEYGKRFRRKHLETRKKATQDEADNKAFNKICAIIQREQQHDFWQRLNYVLGKKQMHSATTIQVKAKGGAILERTMQDEQRSEKVRVNFTVNSNFAAFGLNSNSANLGLL